MFRLDTLQLIINAKQILDHLIVQFAGEMLAFLFALGKQAPVCLLESLICPVESLNMFGQLFNELAI